MKIFLSHLCTLARVGALALVGALIPGPSRAEAPLYQEGPPGTSTEITADSNVTFGAFARLAEQSAPAVITVEVESAERAPPSMFFGPDFGPRSEQRGAGSGFIIRGDGLALTNHHVIAGATAIVVKLLDGREFAAKVVGSDEATDVALLKIDTRGASLPVVPLGDSDALKIGDWVLAIGNPLGLSHTVTAGIVSAKHRVDVRPGRELRYADFIQTDASINPGNSGGPLFNTRGEVVGINSAINPHGQGIGFAIPVNMVKSLLPALHKDGHVSRSWMGLQIQEVSPALARSFGLDRPTGALIASVVKGGPADKAGLREGDIVTRFDGRMVGNEGALPFMASTAGVGRTVTIERLRDGKRSLLPITLAAMPGREANTRSRDREADVQGEGPAALGLRLGSAPRSEGAKSIEGVRILDVESDSPAADVGVRPGDVIVQVDGQRVSTPAEVKRLFEAKRKGEVIRLLLDRGAGRTFVAFTR